ncbi:MAG: substrate-binding domain-containing protein [Gammaproteobacteria bacterium]|nr:substrate-binding domain-containing protein [Gammaproteobacteria bacterium]
MLRSRTVLGWLFGALVLVLSTGAEAEDPPGRILVGFSQDTLANDWRAAQVNDLKRELARHPNVELVVTDGKGSTAQQIRDIEDLVARKVDVLVTSPRDGTAMTPVVSGAYRAGIPVVLLTRRIDSQDYTTFISPDDAAIGRESARHLAAVLKGHGDVLMLEGVRTATTAQLRTRGFLDELKAHPGLRLVAVKTANYLRNDAIRAMEEVFREGLHFDAIFSQSDSMASGARIALRGAGRDPKDVVIVGIDYIAEAREAIRSGEESASFTYPTCAAEAAQVVMEIAAGRDVPRYIAVPSQKITRANVERVKPIF